MLKTTLPPTDPVGAQWPGWQHGGRWGGGRHGLLRPPGWGYVLTRAPLQTTGFCRGPLADLEPLPRARLAHGCISGTSTPAFAVGPWGGRWLSGREASFAALDLTASAPVAWGTASVWWRLPATPGTSVPPLRAGGPRPQAVPTNAALSEQRPTGWGSSVSTCFPGGGGPHSCLGRTAPRGPGWAGERVSSRRHPCSTATQAGCHPGGLGAGACAGACAQGGPAVC